MFQTFSYQELVQINGGAVTTMPSDGGFRAPTPQSPIKVDVDVKMTVGVGAGYNVNLSSDGTISGQAGPFGGSIKITVTPVKTY